MTQKRKLAKQSFRDLVLPRQPTDTAPQISAAIFHYDDAPKASMSRGGAGGQPP